MKQLEKLVNNVKACELCINELPHGVRPVLQIDSSAKILIAGQAPGRKVHESGIAFDDASGERLRQWLGINSHTFYDASQVAILPMGFCFPGTGTSGDLPPRSLCAQTWREQLLAHLPQVQLTIVLGKYAQDYHLGKSTKNVTQRVQAWQETWPHTIALPHPSGRNNIWLKRNDWFERDVIPLLQSQVAKVLSRAI